MQIPSTPPPLVSNPLPQDAVAKAVPNIHAMATLLQNAVAPPPKSEKSNQTRDNKDKSKGERGDEKERADDEAEKSDHAVNISV